MRLLRAPEDLLALEPTWRRLERAATWPGQSFAWVLAGARAFGSGGRLRAVVVEDGGELVGAAPLGSRRTERPGTLDLLTTEELNEPLDLLAADAGSLARLAEAVARAGRPLRIGRLPADSPSIAALRAAYGRGGVVVVRERPGCPFLALDASWAEPEAHLNSRRRGDLRRFARRAAEEGPVSAEVLAPGPGAWTAPFEEALAVELRSWRAERNGAIAQDPLRGPFYRALAEAAAAEGTLRIARLAVGEKAVAMAIALAWRHSLWLLKIAYDEAASRYSPGTLLAVEMLRAAAREGLETYEFLGSPDGTSEAWSPSLRPMATLRAYRFLSPRGCALLARDAGAALWDRARRSREKAVAP